MKTTFKKSQSSTSAFQNLINNEDEALRNECEAIFLTTFKSISEDITTAEDLILLLQYGGFNPSQKTIEKYWNKKTEFCTFDQFVAIVKQERKISKTDLLKAFHALDQNNDGYLNHNELSEILTKNGERMTKAEINELFKNSDYNGDGKLDYQEFCSMMEATIKLCQRFHTNKQAASQSKPFLSMRSHTMDKQPSINHKEESTHKLSLPLKLSKKEDLKTEVKKTFNKVSSEPNQLSRWYFQSMKGCIYKNENGKIESQQYLLRIIQPTSVWITVKPATPKHGSYSEIILNTDVMLFLVEDGPKSKVVAYSNSFVDGKLCFQVDLGIGTYRILSYSSGNNLMTDKSTSGQLSIIKGKGEEICLTKPCSDALMEIFYRYDLNGNGYLSRDEFNEFQMRSSGEACDNEAWDVLKETVELTPQDEITPNSFINLHLMEAKDPDGGQEELWLTLESMGYSRKLNLIKVCPIYVEVFTSRGKSVLLSAGLISSGEEANIIKSVIKSEVESVPFKNSNDLLLFISEFPNCIIIAVENQTMNIVKVRLDCSKSINLKSNREDLDIVERIDVKEMKVIHHLTAVDHTKPSQLHYAESLAR